MVSIDGVSCIKGEVHSLLTSMRLTTRWNSSSLRNPRSAQKDTEIKSPFVTSFRNLNEYLSGIFDIADVDCVRYISPFYEIIVSDTASGPLTSVALSSVCKFVMFGFLSTDYPRVQEGIGLVAKCISKCIFEETDWESDEVILMKLLELSTLTLRCEGSKLLSVRASWEIYSTCLSVHNQHRASKILRSEAETALRHLTQSVFSRAHGIATYSEEQYSLELMNQSWDTVSLRYTFDGYMGVTLLLWNIVSVLSGFLNLQSQTPDRVKFSLSLVNIALEAGGPTLSSMQPLVEVLKGEVSRHLLRATQTDDLEMFSLALRVVFNLFMSIKNHMKVQLEVFLTSIHLRLLQTQQSTFTMQAKQELALESLLEFCREPSLMQDLYINYDCDVQCTNLFDSIIAVLCDRCQSTKNTKMPTEQTVNESDALEAARPTILNRLAISGISTILHAVSLKCNQLGNALSFVKKIRQQEFTVGSPEAGEDSQQDLTAYEVGAGIFDASLSAEMPSDEMPLIDSPERPITLHESDSSSLLPAPPASVSFVSGEEPDPAQVVEELRQRKLMKQRLLHTAELFNDKPLKTEWIKFAINQQLVKPAAPKNVSSTVDEAHPADAKSIARFLKDTPGLGRTQIGEFLSRGPADKYPFHAEVLKEYVHTFDFSEMSFVKALRSFLGYFRLPGEAQCIDRLMEAFSKKLFFDLGVGKPFASSDAAFVLAFSTIMLQTDLHNQNVTTKRMTREEFIRNNRGINDGESLPREYLEALYDEIKSKKIEVDLDVGDTQSDIIGQILHLTDTAAWNKLLKRGHLHQAPAIFTPTFMARRGIRQLDVNAEQLSRLSASLHQKEMFLAMEERILVLVLTLWQQSDDDKVLVSVFQMLRDYVKICVDLELNVMFNELVQVALKKTKTMLDASRKNPLHDGPTNKALVNAFYKQLWALEVDHGKHDIERLLTTPVEDLIAGSKSRDSAEGRAGWVGVSLVKGEIMAKIMLHAAHQFNASFDRQSWFHLFLFLMWVRSKGSLPPGLATISHVWHGSSQSRPVDLSKFQPSLFSIMCHRRARGLQGKKDDSANKQPQSTSLLASVASFIFSPGKDEGSGGSLDQEDDEDGFASTTDLNSCLLSEGHRSKKADRNICMDTLLRSALADSPISSTILELRANPDCSAILSTLFDVLKTVIEGLFADASAATSDREIEYTFPSNILRASQQPATTVSAPNIFRDSSDHGPEDALTCRALLTEELREIDALFVLELIQCVVFQDARLLFASWTKLLGKVVSYSQTIVCHKLVFYSCRYLQNCTRGAHRHGLSQVPLSGRAPRPHGGPLLPGPHSHAAGGGGLALGAEAGALEG